MAGTVKVTRNGYNKLVLRKKEFFDQLKKVQGKKGEAAEVGGNVWHDNFAFEELGRQEMMLNKKIADVSLQINSAEIVQHPVNDQLLQIGHIAVFEFDDGEERKYEIAGFGESDLSINPPKVEYLAPIVKKFIGTEINTSVKVEIGGKIRGITLIEILRKEA